MFLKKMTCQALSLLMMMGWTTAGAFNANNATSVIDFNDSIQLKQPNSTSVKPDSKVDPKDEATFQMQHNANREAILKNWKVDFTYNQIGYDGKYVHQAGSKALVLKYLGHRAGDQFDGLATIDLTKLFVEKYQADINTLKVHSPQLISFDVMIDPKKPKGIDNLLRVFVSRDDPHGEFTLIHVIGKVTQDDLNYVVEDFFLRIQAINDGRGVDKTAQDPKLSEDNKSPDQGKEPQPESSDPTIKSDK